MAMTNLPAHSLNELIRQGHEITFPAGTKAVVEGRTSSLLCLESGDTVTLSGYRAFALISADQLSADDWREHERQAVDRQRVFLQELPPRLRDDARATVEVTPNNENSVRALQRFDVEKNLLLYGPAGTGKTTLVLQALLRLAAYYDVRFRSEVELTQALRERSLLAPAATHEVVSPLRTADVLVIDDIGKSKHSDFTYQEFYALLSDRMNHKRGTIFTSNYTPGGVGQRIGQTPEDAEAIRSRIASGVVAALKGPDWRLVHHDRVEGTIQV
jgi:DNA replication protein DnaC